ncbi:MAG: hypothetical protein ABIT01_19145 [Thermoanaerobaculia bacterium]
MRISHCGSILLMVLAAAIGRESRAQGYNTSQLVKSDGNECVGVPGCVAVVKPAVTVPARQKSSERFACPDATPNIWGWDAGQHEHVAVTLVSADRSSVTLQGANRADVAGDFVVALGCSTEPYTGTGFTTADHLAPTGWLRRGAMAGGEAGSRFAYTAPPFFAQSEPPSLVKPNLNAEATHACDGVPFCQAQPQISFYMGGWASTTKSYICKAPYPYAWRIDYTQTGSPSVSNLDEISAAYPGEINVLMTNWNPFQADLVTIQVGCSKNNSFGGVCGAPVSDPQCPVVAGSTRTSCARGPVPVCIFFFQERCPATNQLYSCTDILGLAYCSPCPG